jgi:GrpB-like predicted nucleotidyltransferase (UPF0157 family)
MREIIIEQYNAHWPALFTAECQLLSSALHPLPPATIEHIGSTSVPLLGAKPVIDIMIGVESEDRLDDLIVPIVSLGYEYGKEHEDEMPFRRFFRKHTNGIRSHHIHAVSLQHPFWETHLAFRDHMRANPEDAIEYEQLKRKLAGEHRFDPDGYTDAKAGFIRRIIDKALATS